MQLLPGATRWGEGGPDLTASELVGKTYTEKKSAPSCAIGRLEQGHAGVAPTE